MAAHLPAALPGLLRYAATITDNSDTAEDLVSETLVKALERCGSFRGDSGLSTWLHRILHNLAVDHFRRASREVPADDIASQVEAKWREDDYTVDAAAVVGRAETKEELLDALVHLPLKYRTAVVLHDVEGYTARDSAEIQDISVPAAKQRLRRGRMMLVSQLAAGHERRQQLKGVPLRCWDARSRVSSYLDRELDQAEAARLEKHLAGCPTCPPLYASLVGSVEALNGLGERDPDEVIPAEVADRLKAAIDGAQATRG